MGFFSDLKEDLSQAVSELNDQINTSEKAETQEQANAAEQPLVEEPAPTADETNVSEPALSLDEMLEKIDAYGFPEELMQEVSETEIEEPPEEQSFSAWEDRGTEEGQGQVEEESVPLDVQAPIMEDSDIAEEETAGEEDGFIPLPLEERTDDEIAPEELSDEPQEEQLTVQQEEARELEMEEEFPQEQFEELQEQEHLEEPQEEVQSVNNQNEESKGAEKEMETDTVRVAVEETSVITEAMIITGDIATEGSIDLIGTVNGNVDALGKLNITGHINGNSKAAEIYAESAKINGEVVSEGAVKIGASSVVIGNIVATSAAIAGAVKGDIDVRGPVILDASAIVMGNIKSKSVQINNGAVIEGMCSQCYADVNPTSFFDDYKPEVRKAKSK